MAFNKKKKNNGPSPKLSEVALRNNIRISNPYGYYPDDVDRVILKLENLINTLQAETQKLERDLSNTQDELKAARATIQQLKLDMMTFDVPDTSAEEDIAMFARLSNINDSVGTLEHDMPDIVENSESRIPLDVIENPNNSNDIMFDNLVTNNEQNVIENKPDNINENNSGIYNEFGQLDIL